MDNLFVRLFQVFSKSVGSPYEDVMTELFAELLSDCEILIQLLPFLLGKSFTELSHVSVQTQVTYESLAHHKMNSRPDLVLRFFEGKNQWIVFIESKLEAVEGEEQLVRYADHLNELSGKGLNAALIYITQYADEKDSNQVVNGRTNLSFIPLRWFHVYRFLKNLEVKNEFVNKVLDYMEARGLDGNRNFSPLDMYAIQNINRVQRMMDETMDGVVENVLNASFGRALQQYNRYNQVKLLDRYVKASEQNERATEVVIGYYLTDDDYPIVSVVYEFNERRCHNFPQVIKAMQQFIQHHPDWKLFDINENVEWKGMSCDRSLAEFMTSEDHISEIQHFFMDKLKDLKQIKLDNPTLHWK